VQKHFAKEAVLEVLHKPEKSGNKKAVQKRILQKFRLLQSVTFAVLTGAKRAFFRFVASKTEFRKLSINRNKDLKASATVRRLLAYKNIQ